MHRRQYCSAEPTGIAVPLIEEEFAPPNKLPRAFWKMYDGESLCALLAVSSYDGDSLRQIFTCCSEVVED